MTEVLRDKSSAEVGTSKPSGLATWLAAGALAVSVIAGYFLHDRVSSLEEHAAGSDVLIVDIGQMATMYPSGASQSELDDMIVRVNEVLQRLSEAGYIIIDRQQVLTAPQENRLDSRIIFEEAGITTTPGPWTPAETETGEANE